MPEIGVRELKTRAPAIIREVRENRARWIITYRGKPVGVLMSLEETLPAEASPTDEEVWEELVRLGEEIARGWKSPLTGVELLSQMRDEEQGQVSCESLQ